MKLFKRFFVVCCMLLLLPFTGTVNVIHGEESVRNETQRFLTWYEENKNTEEWVDDFVLETDIYLDEGTKENPIKLDGVGRTLLVDTNHHSIYVRSNVVIDRENLFIYSSGAVQEGPTMIVTKEGAVNDVVLTLKQGVINGGTSALCIDSGELICPEGKKTGEFYCPQDAYYFKLWGYNNAIEINSENVTLKNLYIMGEGFEDNSNVVAVQAKHNVTIEDSDVYADVSNEYPLKDCSVIGIKAGNTIRLKNTQVNAVGENAKSVVSDAGVEHIMINEESTLSPAIDLPIKYDDIYRMKDIVTLEMINVPIGMDINELKLPETMNCQLEHLYDEHADKKNEELSVTWNTEHLQQYLQMYGEYTITGSFSQEELARKHIYKINSFVPTFKISVVRKNLMDNLLFSEIQANVDKPNVKALLYRPYGATSVKLQYSKDGIHWIDGYCIREKDNEKDYNILHYSEILSTKMLTYVYFPQLEEGGYIRSVIQGGPFEGVWEQKKLDIEAVFSEVDGGGGNRGGGGQSETGRDLPTEVVEEVSKEQATIQQDVDHKEEKEKLKEQIHESNIAKGSDLKADEKKISNIMIMVGLITLGVVGVVSIIIRKHKHTRMTNKKI